jgi:hypothetical protein
MLRWLYSVRFPLASSSQELPAHLCFGGAGYYHRAAFLGLYSSTVISLSAGRSIMSPPDSVMRYTKNLPSQPQQAVLVGLSARLRQSCGRHRAVAEMGGFLVT